MTQYCIIILDNTVKTQNWSTDALHPQLKSKQAGLVGWLVCWGEEVDTEIVILIFKCVMERQRDQNGQTILRKSKAEDSHYPVLGLSVKWQWERPRGITEKIDTVMDRSPETDPYRYSQLNF